jgi:site-specific DNA-methyltransferase (adenine-specific)
MFRFDFGQGADKFHVINKKKLQPNVQVWSKNDDVATPKDLYEDLDKEFNFDFDPCPLRAKFDGLKIKWGKRNYVNPPYSNIKAFMKKAIREMEKGNLTVFLIPLRMASKYWERYVYPYASDVRIIAGYIKFQGYEKIRGLNTPIGLVVYDPKKAQSKFRGKTNVDLSTIGTKDVIVFRW